MVLTLTKGDTSVPHSSVHTLHINDISSVTMNKLVTIATSDCNHGREFGL